MKKGILISLLVVLCLLFVACGQQSEQGIQGEAGISVESITKTSTEGLVDTYTIIYTNGDTTTFTVTNGANGEQGQQGIQGIQGEKGTDGHTPVITIQNGRWYIDGVDTGKTAEGIKGETGNGISSIVKTKTEGLVDTYTITYTNGMTTTFTVTNGANGQQGIQGEKGADGHTPVITIQNGRWYIDGVDTGKSAEGVKGDDGLSAYEIYKKYHPEYTGTEEEWLESLKGQSGEKGEQGEQGISIVNAYINEEMHLILVLSNSQQIDAGYVGVGNFADLNTVQFVDYDDTVLHTQYIKTGEDAIAPANPIRSGYIFTGWDIEFENVTSDLIIRAQYERATNQLFFSFKDNGDGITTMTISIKGDVLLAGMECYISISTTGMTYNSFKVLDSDAGANVLADGVIMINYASATNITSEIDLVEITFTNTENRRYAEISVFDIMVFDQIFENQEYSLGGTHYTKK